MPTTDDPVAIYRQAEESLRTLNDGVAADPQRNAIGECIA